MNSPQIPSSVQSSTSLRVDLWSYDLGKPEDRQGFSEMFNRLFMNRWKRKHPTDYSARKQKGFPEYVRALYEEFLIDQARINGPRILVVEHVITGCWAGLRAGPLAPASGAFFRPIFRNFSRAAGYPSLMRKPRDSRRSFSGT
jgi:hypothetical protein